MFCGWQKNRNDDKQISCAIDDCQQLSPIWFFLPDVFYVIELLIHIIVKKNKSALKQAKFDNLRKQLNNRRIFYA